MSAGSLPRQVSGATSVEKSLAVCEALSSRPHGLSVSDLARSLKLPAPTVHRLLSVLRRCGYVRQDEDTARYSLTLKMLDLSFRLLGRSELKLHAYPLLREYVLRTGYRSFIAVPAAREVTYVWSAGPDEVAMHTAYGKEMPGHCSIYFDRTQGTRRLSCLRLVRARDVARSEDVIARFGPPLSPGESGQRLICTCAPVYDYTGHEVARVGLFGHGPDETPIRDEHNAGAWEVARLISMRLGYLSTATAEVTA